MRTKTITLAALAIAAVNAAPAAAQSTKVHYEIVGKTSLFERPATRAKVVTAVDSGAVIQVDGSEELGPTHTRLTVNGQTGWLENTALRRVVTVQDAPLRLADTVRVVRVDTVFRVDTIRLTKARKP